MFYRSLLLTLFVSADAKPADPPPDASLVVKIHKADRILELWRGNKRLERYPVSLGGAPEGDKKKQGDLRTPEGTFYVAWKNPKSNFHLFLGLSYPMPRHADSGVLRGLITKTQAQSIRDAVKKKRPPSQTTRLGGYVGIHGGGVGGDWTLGCIALSNKHIERLYKALKVGDRIEVRP